MKTRQPGDYQLQGHVGLDADEPGAWSVCPANPPLLRTSPYTASFVRHPDGAIYPGSKHGLDAIKDGTSKTILLVESVEQHYSRWTVGVECVVAGLPGGRIPPSSPATTRTTIWRATSRIATLTAARFVRTSTAPTWTGTTRPKRPPGPDTSTMFRQQSPRSRGRRVRLRRPVRAEQPSHRRNEPPACRWERPGGQQLNRRLSVLLPHHARQRRPRVHDGTVGCWVVP